MKFKIKFNLSGKRQLLPFNYQYPLSAWIYKVLAKADFAFTKILHNNGYKIENGKSFKLFTYSNLQFPKHTWKPARQKDRMEVWARKAWLTVSFQFPEQGEKFVMGLFQQQKAFVGDKISGIDMEVESIEVLKDVEIGRCGDVEIGELGDVEIGECVDVKMKAVTAIVLGISVEGEKNEQYELPIHADYKKLFLQNLLDKYAATGKSGIDINTLDFKITKLHTKTNLQTIKAFTPAETKVKGYYYEFELAAPKELIEIGLNAGFGSMNALGFGYCDLRI